MHFTRGFFTPYWRACVFCRSRHDTGLLRAETHHCQIRFGTCLKLVISHSLAGAFKLYDHPPKDLHRAPFILAPSAWYSTHEQASAVSQGYMEYSKRAISMEAEGMTPPQNCEAEVPGMKRKRYLKTELLTPYPIHFLG